MKKDLSSFVPYRCRCLRRCCCSERLRRLFRKLHRCFLHCRFHRCIRSSRPCYPAVVGVG